MSSLDPDDFDTYIDYVKEYNQVVDWDSNRPVEPGDDATAAEIQWYMDAVDAWFTIQGAKKIREQREEDDELEGENAGD